MEIRFLKNERSLNFYLRPTGRPRSRDRIKSPFGNFVLPPFTPCFAVFSEGSALAETADFFYEKNTVPWGESAAFEIRLWTRFFFAVFFHCFGKLKNCVRWANPLPSPIHCIRKIQWIGEGSGIRSKSYRTGSKSLKVVHLLQNNPVVDGRSATFSVFDFSLTSHISRLTHHLKICL